MPLLVPMKLRHAPPKSIVVLPSGYSFTLTNAPSRIVRCRDVSTREVCGNTIGNVASGRKAMTRNVVRSAPLCLSPTILPLYVPDSESTVFCRVEVWPEILRWQRREAAFIQHPFDGHPPNQLLPWPPSGARQR
jgi:hypothetical protein